MNRGRMRETWPGAFFWLGGFVLLCLALFLVSAILLPFAAGFAIAYFLNPLCDRLERLGLPRSLAALAVLLGFLLAFILVLLVLVPLLERQILELVGRIPYFLQVAQNEINALMARLQARLSPETFAQLRDAVGGKLGDAFTWFAGMLRGMLSGSLALFNILSLAFVTPVVAFFLLRDWHRIVTRIDLWLPRQHQATIRQQARLVDATLAGFIRGQAMVCVLMGLFYAIALTLAGLDFGLALGLLTGFLIFIPFLGAAIGAGFALLLAAMQFDSWTSVGVVAGIYLVGQTIEGNILTPKLVGERVNLHPVWVIFALLAFGSLFGLAGLLIAVPVAAIIGVLTRFALQHYLASPLYDPLQPAPPPDLPKPAETSRARDDEPAHL